MANLVERLTGYNILPEEKIAIHSFTGAFNEWGRGKILASEVVAFFTLTPAQQTQATTLAGLWSAAPNKALFMRVLKDMLYLGENNVHSQYRDTAYIVARLQDEVTDQGGTLP